jgi:flagellar hook-associated protein 2
LFSAVADTTAVAGNYSVKVSQLALAQTLAAAGQASPTAAVSGGAASTLTLVVGGATKTVSIGANASLNDIRDAINAAGIGITANVVNDGSGTPYRLTLTANATGTANAISSISSDDGAVNALLGFTAGQASAMTETQQAKDASLTVNGIPITSSSNTVSGAIQGVTLTLRSQSTTAATLTIERNTASVETAITDFVSAYNALYKEMHSVSAYGSSSSSASTSSTSSSTSSSSTSSTSSATTPVFSGDSMVRSLMDGLRDVMTTGTSGGSYSYLSQVGISFQTDGSLKVDSSKLETALAGNFSSVSDLFTSTTGFATRLTAWSTSTIQIGGMLSTRKFDLLSSISDMNTQISRLEFRMSALQKEYTQTYSNLNMFLAQSDSTSSYLTQQFATKSA